MAPPTEESNTEELVTDSDGKKHRKPRFKRVEYDYPVEPRIIQVVKKPKTFVDHSYRDFSQVPADLKFQAPSSVDEMSFSEKVYDILSQEQYTNWIQWLPHGRAFKITVPKRLEQSRVLQKYFGHNRYSSFLRQLNNHGFKHITKGIDRNSYYHECFLRGMKHLLKYMPAGRDARRMMPDPDNEPDFYAISRVCPLPDEKLLAADLQQQTPLIPSGISALQAPAGMAALQSAPAIAALQSTPAIAALQSTSGMAALQSPALQTPLQQSLDFPNFMGQVPSQFSLGINAISSFQNNHAQQQAALHLQQQAAALQQQAIQKKAAAALLNGQMPSSGLNLSQGTYPHVGFQGIQSLQSQAQFEDPAVLAFLLRSRANACSNSLYGFQP